MNQDWTARVSHWAAAGVIDADTVERIRAYEAAHADRPGLRWPVLIALGFGAVMIGSGVLLFVAANWDTLSPSERVTLVLLLTGGFHVAGALTIDRFRAMGVTLHAIGTVALGASIALAGQIFNLNEHWPGGVLLWAVGAGLGWALLRQLPQMMLFALLAPAWLVSEWLVAAGDTPDDARWSVAVGGVLMLSLAYFTAPGPGETKHSRRALMLAGGAALVPTAILMAVTSPDAWQAYLRGPTPPLLYLTGGAVAMIAPILVALVLRAESAWPMAMAVVWVAVLQPLQPLAGWVAVYAWWAIGSIGLAAWGVRDRRTERVNVGALAFAATVVAFYFSQVMDKIGRSASLVGLGLLFLGGGWALERSRRRLVERARRAV